MDVSMFYYRRNKRHMGFWDSLWSGIKTAGRVAGAIGQGALGVLGGAAHGFEMGSAVGGPELGGVIGAALGGASSAIDNISMTANRTKHYLREYHTGDGIPSGAAVLQGLIPSSTVSTMQNAISSLTAGGAPKSVVDVAQAGAKFMDAARKHMSIVAAANAAGATPITKHLGNNMSREIVTQLGARTGIRGDLYNVMHNPVLKGAAMLPTTSAHYDKVMDMIHYGGAEAVAMKALAQQQASTQPVAASA